MKCAIPNPGNQLDPGWGSSPPRLLPDGYSLLFDDLWNTDHFEIRPHIFLVSQKVGVSGQKRTSGYRKSVWFLPVPSAWIEITITMSWCLLCVRNTECGVWARARVSACARVSRRMRETWEPGVLVCKSCNNYLSIFLFCLKEKHSCIYGSSTRYVVMAKSALWFGAKAACNS